MMLVTQDAEGVHVSFDDMDQAEMERAHDMIDDLMWAWDGTPSVMVAALMERLDEIVSEAMGPTQ
jgi:hypothetical protein